MQLTELFQDLMKKVGANMRVYLSHSIRGLKGTDATHEDMRKNCEAIKKVAEFIRERISGIDLYVPAENETFVLIAFDKEYITEEQILDVDCTIIDDCDAVICRVEAIGDQLQGGRKIEIDHAEATNKPYIVFAHAYEAVNWLVHQIMKGDY
ncbi:hypothetical protein LCGC14_1730470 [marine sediment metagenome]|uniref:Uncharacterized protein n=1 Tax=marine sediment metagenome TaxID=412755 RepID=A0A0F9HXH8_9ZZZZ